MKPINLYRYEEENGVVVITPNAKAANDVAYKVRLVAEEGYILIKDDIKTPVVDTDFTDVDYWKEIEEVENNNVLS